MKRIFTKIMMIAILILFAGFQAKSTVVTYTVQVPPQTNTVYFCNWLSGGAGGWNWVEMQRIGDENKFTYMMDHPDANPLDEYSYAAGPGWNYVETDAEGKEVQHAGWSELDVAVAFRDYFAGTSLTYTVEAPAATKVVYIVGAPTGGWGNFVEMQRVGDENKFSITIANVNADMAYEYCAGPGWEYEETDAEGNPVTHAGWSALDVAAAFKDYYVPSGINRLPGKTGLITFCINNTIAVSGIFKEVSIYDITGKKIQFEKATNQFESKPLNPGIYLVKIDKQSSKVVVK